MKYSNIDNIIPDRYTLTPNGITIIFEKLSKEKPSPGDIINIDINLQYSGIKSEEYFTFSDCYKNFANFKFKHAPYCLLKDEIINIKEISYIYDSSKQFFYFIINLYEITSKALYQIYPYTSPFNVNKYLNIFIYTKKKQIEYLKYNVLNNLDTLPKKLVFYLRVISKVTLTSFTKNKDNTHDGNFFYFDAIDINNDTVRIIATYSNANYYYSKIKINNIYTISGNFFLSEISKYQEHDKENPLYKYYKEIKMPCKEIYLGNDSKIIEMDNDDSNLLYIEENKFIEFNNIGNLLKLNNSFVDLINTVGIVIKAAKCYKVTYAIRKIKLLDDSGFIIDTNLWNQYTLYPVKVGDILIIKNIQIKKDNKGINFLTTVDETELIINPDIEKKEQFKKIYEEYIDKFESNKIITNSRKFTLKNKFEKKDNNCILKYINISTSVNFIFISDLIEKNKNKISTPKLLYGYINKLIYSKLDDIVICTCIKCSKKLKQKDAFWFCSNCKKNYICPNYAFNDMIINIIDSSGNININLSGKKVKEIFGISPDKNKNLENIILLEKKIKYKLCCVYSLNNYDTNRNLIVEDFKFITQEKIKEQNLIYIKNYFF